jgi:predicted acyl esterase
VVIAEHEHAPDMTDTPQLSPGVLLAWFDHWVGEVDGVPVPSAPTFTSFEGPAGTGAGWVDVDGWDPTGAGVAVELATDDGTTELRQAGDDRDDLVFTGAPLARDEVLRGHPSLTFRAALDADDAHFCVELLDVDTEGGETLVNDGYLKASHRASHTDPIPVPAGDVIDYRVPIRAQHYRFAAGHRVRVRLGGGAAAKLTAPPAPVTITLEDGSATLRLPGFGPGGG